MARTLSASTDRIEYTSLIAATTAMSFYVWVKGPTATGTACKMLGCQEDQWRVSLNAEKYGGGTPTAGAIYFGRSWGTTDQVTQVQSPGATWANANHIAVTYDGSSTSNAAKIYLNGVLLTNSFTRNAAGTIDNATGNPNVGNDNAHTLSALGTYGWAGFHSVVLTQAEILEAMWRGYTTRGAILLWPLLGDSSEPDISGNKRTGTVTGATAAGGVFGIRPGLFAFPGYRELPPAGFTIAMQAGTVVTKGANPTISPGPVTASMQAGTVVTKGGNPTIAPGPVGLTLNAGTVVTRGGSHTISPGPVGLTMQAGSVVVRGGNPAITTSDLVAVLLGGAVVVTGAQPSVAPGPVGMTMTAGSVVTRAGNPTISGVPAAVALNAGTVVTRGGNPTVVAAQAVTMPAGAVATKGANLSLSGGVGPTVAPVITYKIEVQWDNSKAGDGSSLIIGTGLIGTGELWNPTGYPFGTAEFQGTYDNLSTRAKRFTIDRGRTSVADPTFAGRAEVVLHDPSGIFNPANASSPIAGNVAPMRVIRITATYDGTSYVLFRGLLRRIAHRPSSAAGVASETVLTAEDYLMYLDRTERVVDQHEDLCVDGAIGTILATSGLTIYMTDVSASNPSGYSGGSIYIPGSELGSEVTSLPLMRDLTLMNQGQLYAAREGYVTFRARSYRADGTAASSPVGTISSSSVGLIPSVSIDSVVNRVTATRSGSVDGDNGGLPQTVADGDSLELYGASAMTISSPYLTSDAQAANLAAFVVANQGDPTNELQAVSLRSSDAATMRLMLDIDLNDPVVVIDRAAGTATYWVEGVKHESSSAYGGHEAVLTLSKVKSGLPSYSG